MRRSYSLISFAFILILSLLLSGCVRSAHPPIGLPAPAKPTSAGQTSIRPTQTPTRTAVPPAVPTRTPQPATATAGLPAPNLTSTPPVTVAQSTPPPVLSTPAAMQYEVQAGSPVSITNFLHPASGCNWVGLGGQVFGADGAPVSGIKVVVTGSLDNKQVAAVATTGRSDAIGPGGYELALSLTPVKNSGDFKAQLFNQTGRSISDPVSFTILNSCKQNQVLLNFVALASKPAWTNSYLPMIVRSPDSGK